MLARGEAQRPSRTRRARDAEVRVPSPRRPAPSGRRSARAWCRSTSRSSCAATVSSSRCGNGNAGASTIVVAVRRATSRRALVLVTSQSGEPTSSPWIGQTVVVGVQRQPPEVDVDARGAVAARREAIAPTARAAGARRCARRAARRRHPGARGARGRRGCSDTPVMPTPGTNVARSAPLRSSIAGVSWKRRSTTSAVTRITSWARPAPGSRPGGVRPRTAARRRA